MRQTLWDRLWRRVDASGDCWIWTGYRLKGYGRIGLGERSKGIGSAHRVAWELLVGPIPDGMELDHLCRVPACVNPDHLEVVTHAENVRRSYWQGNPSRIASHCFRGHPLPPIRLMPSGRRQRHCRTCENQRRRLLLGKAAA